MCGIAGVQHNQSSRPDMASLQAMAHSLAHRGPDDEGIEIYDRTAFIHRRLSIIDLSSGHQPLKSDPGLSLIANGEIYNYRELKETFSSYPYYTQSDCEVLLALYQEKGLKFLQNVRGMYALALYDESKGQLILARDPFGIKQLYYTITGEGMAFASEAQALIKGGYSASYVHPQARAEVLQSRFTPGSQSIFAPIHRVMPGEILVFEKGCLEDQHMSSFVSFSKPSQKTEKDALIEFEEKFKESVQIHLRSDVPYGLFLSGGLDSGALLHFMASETQQPIKTFTIGFDHGSVHDERFQARVIADHYKTHHHEMVCTEKDFWATLPLVAAAVDDPVFDQALVPTYMLAQEAAKSVKVVLCGEGGDEMLAGYRRYQKAKWPRWLGGKLRRHTGLFEKAGLKSSHLEGWEKGLQSLEKDAQSHFTSPVMQAQWIDCQSWLAHSLLIKLDRCLMSHGLEGRTPFLEPKFAEFCLSLPDSLKTHWNFGKWILRRYLQDHAPHLKPFDKKKGFRVPVDAWLLKKAPRLAVLVARQPGIEELFDAHQIKDFLCHPPKKHMDTVWSLVFYALWHQIHIMNVPVSADTLSVLSRQKY